MFGLDEKLIESIRNISKKYPKNKFVVFGSRARGDYKTTSDIDIAILGRCDDKIEFNIKNKFDLIDTFYMFDIVFYENLKDEKFKKSIDIEGVEI